MYLFQQIEETIFNYNDSRKIIGEFILENAEKISEIPMEKIAQETYTSKASLVRFAKKLGYSGWREFVLAFREEVIYEQKYTGEINPNIPFNKEDDYMQIARNIKTLQTEALEDTFNQLDKSTLFKATQILLQADTIMFFCISPYIYLADIFRRKMLTIGKHIIVTNPLEASIATQSLTEKDCAIIISYSGTNDTIDPLSHIKDLKENNVSLIGLTSGGENTLRKNANVTFTISSREKLYSKIANFSTEESINYILNTLFSCYFNQNYEENLKNKIATTIKIESKKRFTHLKNIQE